MGGKMRPCKVFCADSKEVNPNMTNSKSGQTSRLKLYVQIWHDSMRQILRYTLSRLVWPDFVPVM